MAIFHLTGHIADVEWLPKYYFCDKLILYLPICLERSAVHTHIAVFGIEWHTQADYGYVSHTGYISADMSYAVNILY